MIVINGRFLTQRITGVQRFAYEICRALRRIGVNFVILAPSDTISEYAIEDLPVKKIGGKGSHFWEQVTLPWYMHRHYRGLPLLSLSGLSPVGYNHTIMTIHDVSYLLRPRAYSWLYTLYYRIMTPWAAKRAKQILTVSRFSKQEIMRYYHLDDEKITVVYNAARTTALAPRKETRPYLLVVGSLMPRKNIRRLIEAYSTMPDADFNLLIAGITDASFADAGLDAFAHTRGVQWLGHVSPEKLNSLYRNATAYINPSLYEGFGIPLLEAMAQECPVLASDIPVFHEVCDAAACYFNPMKTEEIQSVMYSITHDEALRQQLIQAGRQRFRLFSWDASARTIRQLLDA